MMDTAGKLLKKVHLQRLNDHLDRTGGLSSNQFGFHTGRSTADAISKILDTANWTGNGYPQYQELYVLVEFYIRNVFNTTPLAFTDATQMALYAIS